MFRVPRSINQKFKNIKRTTSNNKMFSKKDKITTKKQFERTFSRSLRGMLINYPNNHEYN